MLVGLLLVTALLVSDVAGTDNSSEVEETVRAIEELTRGPCENGWFVYRPTRSCYRYFRTRTTWKDAENGNFLWSDESSVRFMNWAVVNPRDRRNARYCAYINTRFRGWYDYNCNGRLSYVCAYKYH